MSRVMGMKAHFCASRTFSALDSHFEWPFTSYAKLIFALSTGEVHTSAFCQGISEFAIRTLDSMFFQVLFNTFGLVIRIIVFFPSCEIFTRQTFVSAFPLQRISISRLPYFSWTFILRVFNCLLIIIFLCSV